MAAIQMNRTHRVLIGVVVTGAMVIAAIGFAGSYAAVRDLAERKGFGAFSAVLPIGIDAGIVVLLALDLLLTWLRIPFPLLRQTAWLLTAATIAFNGATAWPDPLGVGMHAVIPVLFVVAVEAARHAIGRIADITADRHMESVRIARWLLAFPSTFRLWRRMKLWELRSYDEVIRFEQDRLVYRARLRARYGRAWRRKAPVESLMPLTLARYGVPLSETGPAGLAAAGITVPDRLGQATVPAAPARLSRAEERLSLPGSSEPPGHRPLGLVEPAGLPATESAAAVAEPHSDGSAGAYDVQSAAVAGGAGPQPALSAAMYAAAAEAADAAQVTVPVGPNRRRSLGKAQANGHSGAVPPAPPRAPLPKPPQQLFIEPAPQPDPQPAPQPDPQPAPHPQPDPEPAPHPQPDPEPAPHPQPEPTDEPVGIPDGIPREEVYFEAYRQFIADQGKRPTARQLSRALHERFGVVNADGSLLSEGYLRLYMREFRDRYDAEMGMAG